ncbi:hypothetical protein NC651_001728 [Populus alba x Populus x berolinensis]|nr:hypothetical protein NC651_001728 [Populus alba x Populus x berolinensis]
MEATSDAAEEVPVARECHCLLPLLLNVRLGFCLWLLRSILHHPRQTVAITIS